MHDLIAVLNGSGRHAPVHVELICRGITTGEGSSSITAALQAIASELATCPLLSSPVDRPLSLSAHGTDDSVTISLSLRSVSVNVVISADEKALFGSAELNVVSSTEAPERMN